MSKELKTNQGFGRPYVYVAAIVVVLVVAAYRSAASFFLFAVGLFLLAIGISLAAAQHAKWERDVPRHEPDKIYAYLHTAPKWGVGQSLSLAGLLCIGVGLWWLARLSHALLANRRSSFSE
jgi:hypothetical protein